MTIQKQWFYKKSFSEKNSQDSQKALVMESIFNEVAGLGLQLLHCPKNFLLKISSVNVTKSAENCEFGRIY